MKYLITSFAFIIFCSYNLVAQNNQNKIKQFEAEVYTASIDQKAVELIEVHNEAKEAFQVAKALVLSEYDEQLNLFEKNQKFKKEESESNLFKNLTGEVNETRIAMQNYLKQQYPEYRKLFQQNFNNRRTNKGRTLKKAKVPPQAIKNN